MQKVLYMYREMQIYMVFYQRCEYLTLTVCKALNSTLMPQWSMFQYFRYCGHGSGGRYFNSDDLEKLQGRAAIILMGCSSGKLSVKGQLEPSGMMISYFLAGW